MKFLIALFVVNFAITNHLYSQRKPSNSSWEAISKAKKGSVTVYWYDNNPFVYKDANGDFRGIEYEILDGFKRYLADSFKIDLHLQWTRLGSFGEVMARIKQDSVGIFGTAGISITAERAKIIKFSPSYMADIAVLVSTEDIPTVRKIADFKDFEGTTAITIPGTLMEKDIVDLGVAEKVKFDMKYVSNNIDFLNAIKKRKRSFGYLNLPVYLMNLNNGLAKVKRQNYFTRIKDGHGIGFPKNSDWDVPLNAYFKSLSFKMNIENIVSHYISIDFYHFIATLTTESEVTILNKEKEIQQKEIILQDFQIAERTKRQEFLIVVIGIGAILLFIILVLFRNQWKSNNLLKEQKHEIESQADEIKSINDYLEDLVKQRTTDLERKNQALEEYAFITAHKLRAPLASILGLILLFERVELSDDDKILLTLLKRSARELDIIIHTVMDSIESGDTADVETGSEK